jgi:hypothetical protein
MRVYIYIICVCVIRFVLVITAYRILKYVYIIVPHYAYREHDLAINMHNLPVIANM